MGALELAGPINGRVKWYLEPEAFGGPQNARGTSFALPFHAAPREGLAILSLAWVWVVRLLIVKLLSFPSQACPARQP